ncbi:peptidase inhibitor family I36 protein [Microbacterium album]|uniref:Peptidase inhibitor family I36 n=1 Tax=Microbacterium album TaxID=2053191 RepID=A0A917ICH7_9MICO|nr:peptidase inhibitor family I36 protein [Microbacterium album]GGH33742.1 hypothetical protein GCM10010921_00940 [Microbacterium album]
MAKKLVPAAMAIAGMLFFTAPTVTFAAETPTQDMQERVEAALADRPGGVQTSWNEVNWDDGRVVLTLDPTSSRAGSSVVLATDVVALAAVGGCASGTFCAYNQTGYRGDKITFSTCASSHSVSGLVGSVRSIANSRSSGVVRAYNGTTLLASATAGNGSNVSGTTNKLTCS